MSQHIIEKSVYYRVFAVLLGLMVVTILAASIQHPTIGLIVAITIAVTKAVLIILFFMHVLYSRGLIRVLAGAGFLWLLLLLVLSASDYMTRA